jgi:3-hydroxyacyl-CoA dehydrogenase
MEKNDVRTVGIVGTGLVGSSWAVIFALAGLDVLAFDESPEARSRLPVLAARTLAEMEAAGLARDTGAALARIRLVDTLSDAVRAADYVQESAFETLEVKTRVSSEIGAALRADAIVGSSSSGIPASAFTEAAEHRDRFLIAHPVNPPHLIPVVELVPSPWTAPDVLPRVRALMERIGQVPVVVRREIEGFILNRLQGALLNEAFALFEEGYATAADIDATISQGLGLRWAFIGPFETIDLNAPGGVEDYAHRFGPLYRSIAQSRVQPRGWSPDLVASVTAERRGKLPASALAERRDWRDRRLMALAAHLRGRTGS